MFAISDGADRLFCFGIINWRGSNRIGRPAIFQE